MRARTLVAVVVTSIAVASLFTGCRAVVGIEDLEVADAAADGASATDAADAGAEAGDATTDDVTDAKPRTDVEIIAEGCAAGDCRKCCKQAFGQQNQQFEQKARASACICGGNPDTCSTECASTACAASPMPPSQTCAPCLDDHLVGSQPACVSARTDCKNDPLCAPIAICLERCALK